MNGKNQRQSGVLSYFRLSDFLLKFSASTLSCGLVFPLAFSVFAQDLPDKINGYKVYKAKIKIQNQSAETKSKDGDARVNLGEPTAADVSVSGVTFKIGGELTALKQSGHVDFLAFRGFRVNGLSVEIEEYREPFEFSKNQTVKFPKPIVISLGFGQAMSGWLDEWRDSKEYWTVTGRVFVFGRFKKAGFVFKRVIPVDVNLQIKNPLKYVIRYSLFVIRNSLFVVNCRCWNKIQKRITYYVLRIAYYLFPLFALKLFYSVFC